MSLKEHNTWLDAALRRQLPQDTGLRQLVPEQCGATPDNNRFCVLAAGHAGKCKLGEILVSGANVVDPKVDRGTLR